MVHFSVLSFFKFLISMWSGGRFLTNIVDMDLPKYHQSVTPRQEFYVVVDYRRLINQSYRVVYRFMRKIHYSLHSPSPPWVLPAEKQNLTTIIDDGELSYNTIHQWRSLRARVNISKNFIEIVNATDKEIATSCFDLFLITDFLYQIRNKSRHLFRHYHSFLTSTANWCQNLLWLSDLFCTLSNRLK